MTLVTLERARAALADLARDACDLLVQQLTPPFLSLGSQLYWMHIAGALLLTILVYVLSGGEGQRRSPAEFQRLYLSSRVFWHRSARLDYVFYVVNGVIFPLLFIPLLPQDEPLRLGARSLFETLFAPRAAEGEPGLLATAALAGLVFLAYDFGRWLGHYMQHRVPLLWEFHKVHHSAEVLTPITTFRAHPVDLAVMAIFTSLPVAAAAGLAMSLFPADATLFGSLSLYVAAVLFAFDVGGSMLRHSSVWLSYGPVLGRVFISPAQHQIHHSTEPRHWNKNMGFALALWDWMAGTLYITGEREDVVYGSGDGDDSAYRSVWRLYTVPFRRIVEKVQALAARPATGTPRATGACRPGGE